MISRPRYRPVAAHLGFQRGPAVGPAAAGIAGPDLADLADLANTTLGASDKKETVIVRVDRIPHPVVPLLVALDPTGALVWVGLGARVAPLVRFARKHGLQLRIERGAPTPARRQLTQYLAGTRRAFDLALHVMGTPFQRRAWRALGDIPYGETRSYGAQARAVGSPGAARAVGRANGQNHLPIVIPCHRVIGQAGGLTGFGGGVPVKRWLLGLEAHGVPPAFTGSSAGEGTQLGLFS